jgi:hypothetical protein
MSKRLGKAQLAETDNKILRSNLTSTFLQSEKTLPGKPGQGGLWLDTGEAD